MLLLCTRQASAPAALSRLRPLCAVGHVWYNTLDALVMPKDPKSNKAVVLKMLCDQVIWAPFFSCVFFTFIYLLQARAEEEHKLT